MNLFDRMITKLKSLFASTTSRDPMVTAKMVILKQKQSQKRLRENMTELIYQRKRLDAQLEKYESHRFHLKADLELAARENRDDLAIKLMEQLDQLVVEMEETKKNRDMVAEEIETAKSVEQELGAQIEKSQSQLAILASRVQSVKMREQLHGHFERIHKEISAARPGLSEIDESILHLEARLENIQDPKEDWKKEVSRLRKSRTDHVRKARLEQLKAQLNSRSLTGRVIVPEIINH